MDPDPKPFRRVYHAALFATFVTATGMTSFIPFFAYNLRDMGLARGAGLELWTGMVTGAAPLVAALAGPLWGAIGDRVGQKLMLMRALLGIALFVGLMAFATQPWHLLVLRLGQGLFSGFIAPCMTLVSLHSPEDQQSKNAAGIQVAVALGFCVGPALGGEIRECGESHWVFLFTGCAALLACAQVWWRVDRDRPARESQAAGSPKRSVLGALLAILVDPRVRTLLIALFAVRLAFAAMNSMIAIFVASELQGVAPALHNRLVAWAFTGPHLITVLAARRWGRIGDRSDPRRVLCACCLGAAVLVAPIAAVEGPVLFLALVTLAGIFYSGVMPLGYGVVARSTERSQRGSGFGLLFSSLTLALATGPVIGGGVSQLAGSVRPLFLVSAGLCLFAAAVLRFGRSRASGPPIS